MKFSPRNNQIIGRMVVRRTPALIIRPSEVKVTKLILVDAVGSEAAAAGIKVGDVIVPSAMGNIVLDDGFRPVLEEKSVAFFVTEVLQDELLVQTDNGAEFVPFDSPKAAKPLGAAHVGYPHERAAQAAAEA